jgi:hypothetical protein
MKQLSRFLAGLSLLAMIVISSAQTEDTLKEVQDTKYKPGQVWSYKARPDEQKSTITILRVDETPKAKRIVHIRVDHVQLTNCQGGNAPNTFEHMPFAKEALDQSVLKVVRTSKVPDFENGYAAWRAGWDAKKAGYYTIPVAEALDVAQKTFNQGIGCPN